MEKKDVVYLFNALRIWFFESVARREFKEQIFLYWQAFLKGMPRAGSRDALFLALSVLLVAVLLIGSSTGGFWGGLEQSQDVLTGASTVTVGNVLTPGGILTIILVICLGFYFWRMDKKVWERK